MSQRGASGRAELLQAMVLQSELTWLEWPQPSGLPVVGYSRRVERAAIDLPIDPAIPPAISPILIKEGAGPSLRPPLQMPYAWRADVELHLAPEHDQPTPAQAKSAAVPFRRATQAEADSLQDLLDADLEPATLRRRLRAALAEPPQGAHRIDWPLVVKRIARGHRLTRLPRHRRPLWPGHLQVLVDIDGQGMQPFQHDLNCWSQALIRSVGAGRLCMHQWKGAAGALTGQSAPGMREVGHRWLVLSDGGLAEPERRAAFSAWTAAMQHRQHRLRVLAPVPALALASLPPVDDAVAWSGASGRSIGRDLPAALWDTEAVGGVLALIAMLGQVSAVVLKALCQLLDARDPALIWQVWMHPHVVRVSGTHVEVVPKHLEAHAKAVAALPVMVLIEALKRQQTLQRGLPDADLHACTLRAVEFAPALQHALAAEYDAALQYFHAWVRQGALTAQGASRHSWSLQATRLIGKVPRQVLSTHRSVFRSLAQEALRDAALQGEALPHWPALGMLSPPQLPLKHGETVPQWFVVQEGSAAVLRTRPPVSGAVLAQGADLPLQRGAMIDHSGRQSWTGALRDGDVLVDLADANDGVSIGFDDCTVRLARQSRPWWAEQFEQRKDTGAALIRWPDGEPLWLDPSPFLRYGLSPRERYLRVQLDEVGPWLQVGLVSQRELPSTTSDRIPDLTINLRWIPPGWFMMGSELGQGDRDEHPRHPVTLTRGLWLADTPCTQALWQAVMGNNPSHFKDRHDAAERPVEQVSWEDVQAFLARLKAWLPEGLEPVLPTEAEREYACRAGSVTAYAWGEAFDPERANVDHGKGALNETSPVKRFAPNAWGLYDMHGNVWEWCADGPRDYDQRPQTDPLGPQGPQDPRVLRGGSWSLHPAFARSASRDRWQPGYRRRDVGFRLALRSPSPGPGGPATSPGAQAGGQRPSAAAAEPARPKSWTDRVLDLFKRS